MKSPCSSPTAAVAVALALCAALARPARADERPPEYEDAFKRGTELFERGAYADARAAFEQAYAIHPEPLLLLNIGSTHRREGSLERALEYYQRYLTEAPEGDPYRTTVEQIVAELEAEIERARPEPEPERKPEPEPEPHPAPPVTTVAVSPTPHRAPDRGRALRITGIATGSVGIALAGVGIYYGVRAGDIESELASATGPWTPERQDRYDEGQSAEQRAILFGVSGGVLVAAGATLYLLGYDRGDLAVAPHTDGTTTSLTLRGTF